MFKPYQRAYQVFFDENPQPMWIYDSETLQIYASNQMAKEVFGYSEKEFFNLPISKLASFDDDKHPERSFFLQFAHNLSSSTWQGNFFTKSGFMHLVNAQSYVLDSSSTAKVRVLMAQTVKQCASFGQGLKFQCANFAAIFESSIQIKYLFDVNYTILQANQKAFESARVVFEQSIELNHSILKYIRGEENRHGFIADFENARQGAKIQKEIHFQTIRGKELYYEICHLPIFDSNGKVAQVMLSMYDVTEKKHNELKMAQQIQDLQDFAFLTSHELRRPLANILGLTSIFNKKNLADDFNSLIINYLESTAQELDSVIHQMNQTLAEKNLLNEMAKEK
ncbi:MAG: PAS domain S-box protein [Microscillaceae bacterium]|jgi:PAS domain S-box-containing protein|nr:PAS domain S-box protein [Microscillaceae bacterium]